MRGDAGHIVGVDAGQHTVTAIVADLRGTILARAAQTLDSQRGSVRRSTVRNTVDKALALAGIQPEEVFLVVVGVPAPVDDKGRSPDSTEYWRNMNPDFPAVFADCGRTVVDNDANLAALAERAHGADADSFAALLSGERFGAGLVIDGVLLRGPRGAAGEMRLLNVVEGVGSADGIGLLGRKWAVDASRAGKYPRDQYWPGSARSGCPPKRCSTPQQPATSPRSASLIGWQSGWPGLPMCWRACWTWRRSSLPVRSRQQWNRY